MSLVSYKKYSNNFFTAFIISIICLIFCSSLGTCLLLNFNFACWYLFCLLIVLRKVLLFITVSCAILTLGFDLYSSYRISKSKEQLLIIYEKYKPIFEVLFKQYIRLKKSNFVQEDIDYIKNKMKLNYEKYLEETQKPFAVLHLENQNLQTTDICPNYVERLYKGILNDTLDIDEFVDIINSENNFIYLKDKRFIFSRETKVYLFKELFAEKMADMNSSILMCLK